ncbi:type II toxin-antitoxin system VapC family toxin [Dawidia soli]|uniref:Type II toxin-antitoxin system VapC family toxin n=1 Tax=Dawidia soli TaxID=2782352 RepID=A0AAP2DEB7_9BACT|nr:type II toxin-antitoxin system VapC family toxin [Dawidia soli]MBT1689205.1 type II toxin-antitoxin system VapC family toxin [Dawidia soli]
MGIKHLWDTNTCIYYLQRQLPVAAEKYIDTLLTESPPCISAITEIELLCWKNASEQDTAILHHFIHDSFVIELERAIKLKTADIRKQYKIKLPDAIIAATAVIYDLTLVTHNVRDFTSIPGLIVEDPWTK